MKLRRCFIVVVQPITIVVKSWKERPMKESDVIVANWAHGLSNRLWVSPKGNVLAVARWGHAGGLTSIRAVTSSRNCLKHREEAPRERGLWDMWECRIRHGRMKAKFQDKVDGCVLETPRCIGNGTDVMTAMQSRDLPYSIRECGSSDEAIVAMTAVIISRWSEGPLGCRGLGWFGNLGDCPQGLFTP